MFSEVEQKHLKILETKGKKPWRKKKKNLKTLEHLRQTLEKNVEKPEKD